MASGIRTVCSALLWFVLSLHVVAQEDFCNICGQGNSIQFPQGVVEFFYDGVMRKNNCNTWQNVVKKPKPITEEFCRNEMLQYTYKVCRCTTPTGEAVVLPTPPTVAPTTGSVALPFTDVPTAYEGFGTNSMVAMDEDDESNDDVTQEESDETDVQEEAEEDSGRLRDSDYFVTGAAIGIAFFALTCWTVLLCCCFSQCRQRRKS